MTPSKVAETFNMYATWINRHGKGLTAKRMDPTKEFLGLGVGGAEHLLWMCEEGHRLVTSGHVEKAMRWLGFIQGAFWIGGDFTIAEMMEHNRP